MNRKQIMGNVLNGAIEFRVVNGPVACHASAGFAGFSIKGYSTDEKFTYIYRLLLLSMIKINYHG